MLELFPNGTQALPPTAKTDLLTKVVKGINDIRKELNLPVGPVLQACDECQDDQSVEAIVEEWSNFSAQVSAKLTPQQAGPLISPTWAVAEKMFASTLYKEWFGESEFSSTLPGGLQIYFQANPDYKQTLSEEARVRLVHVMTVVTKIHGFKHNIQ